LPSGRRFLESKTLTVMSLVTEEGRAGSDRLALDISKGLKRRGHRVILCAPSDYALKQEADESGLEMFSLPPWKSLHSVDLSSFIRFCKIEGVDIVNTHHSVGRHMLLKAKLRGLGPRTVFTRHCILRTLPYLGVFPHNFLVDMNIAVSEVVRRSLLRSGILPKCAVTVYGGVERNKFVKISEAAASVRERFGRLGALTIGMIARLQHGKKFSPEKPTLKGHEVIFRALAGLRNDVNLLLLGPWIEDDIRKLKLIAEANRFDAGKIVFCGFQEDIAPFYGIMDINVLPSPNEGLPLAIIEPMAAGVPCIGADGGGIREIITNGVDGFLFRPGDADDLAGKIRILYESRETRELFVAKAKEKVREKFDIENTVLKTEKVFYQLLMARKNAPQT